MRCLKTICLNGARSRGTDPFYIGLLADVQFALGEYQSSFRYDGLIIQESSLNSLGCMLLRSFCPATAAALPICL